MTGFVFVFIHDMEGASNNKLPVIYLSNREIFTFHTNSDSYSTASMFCTVVYKKEVTGVRGGTGGGRQSVCVSGGRERRGRSRQASGYRRCSKSLF